VSNFKQFFRVAAAAALLQSGIAAAQDSLDALLQEVQAVRATVQQQLQQRADEYNAAAADQQAKMLADAQARRDALAASSDKLAAQFSENEIAISEANKKLREKAAALGLQEVFGLARQVAGDSAAILQQSLISTQFPPKDGEASRDQQLRDFAASQTAPTAADLEQVWLTLQQEMVASGKVAK
jgi:biopolymer transport protein ExbB